MDLMEKSFEKKAKELLTPSQVEDRPHHAGLGFIFGG